jgi:acyl-CoA thioester hydrolase
MTSFPEPSSGLFDGPVHRYAVRAFFEDTDLSGVVYHANYLRWFERARSDMLRLLGIDQRSVFEAGGGAYAVSELTIRYAAPAKLDDTVWIESTIEEMRAASCRMLQKAFRANVDANVGGSILLTEARIRVGFVGPDGRPRRQPEDWRKAFAAITLNTESSE